MKNKKIKITKIKETTPYLNLIDKKEVDDFYSNIEKNEDGIFGIYAGDLVVGFAEIDDNEKAWVYVYIFPIYRRKGYGFQAIKAIEKGLKASPLKSIETTYDMNNRVASSFAKKCGYYLSWASSHMSYKGNKFDIANLPIRNYEESDFDNVYYFVDEAFHNMRLSTGWFPDSKLEEPNEESRKWYADSKKDTFLYVIDNEIVGCVNLEEGEINVIAIKTSEQGKGYGRLLTKFATNVLIDRGYKEPSLWCVVNNKKARNLYDSLGYKEVYVAAFAKKKINY